MTVCLCKSLRKHYGDCQVVRAALRGREQLPDCGQRGDPRPVPPVPLLSPGPAAVYLLVDTDGEDIPVPQRLLAKHQAMVELLDWLVAPGGSVGVGQADQLSAPRMQLRRHLQWAASSSRHSELCDSNVMATCSFLSPSK